MRNGVSISPRKGKTASELCNQSGNRGSGITIPEKKKMAGAASRLMPSPEIVQNRHAVINATNDAARSKPANDEMANNNPAESEAGPFRPRNKPETIKMGTDRMSKGAARPLSARVNQTV